ncbi:hypothetical protein POTOM_025518 [Populus tomentosa]|uniref:Uncharacterized protein n=1 Tax=Populus tomentosa TaxID=118781 RepID=A0A8X8CXG0_POPTO|nr:hypothetical protein POTOM_025518 [Populus tomentosa]
MTFICDRSPPLLNSGFQASGLMHGGDNEMAALEAEIGSVDGENAVPKNERAHVMDRRKNGSQGGQQIASIASGGKSKAI